MRNYADIPIELQTLEQWVVAYYDEKIPYDTWGRPASVSDWSRWSAFLPCRDYVTAGHADYLGFVFHNNGIVGIDIDAGYEEGMPTDLLVDIMGICGSYTEISRSGRGVHILVRGDIPFNGRNNRNGVEIYKSGRFFIMTGDVIVYDTIIENQAGIDYVISKYFPESMDNRGLTHKIYTPTWRAPANGRVRVRPDYSPLGPGERNTCLTSLAGAMWSTGYTTEQILNELRIANRQACSPVLPDGELRSICRSISRYRRK